MGMDAGAMQDRGPEVVYHFGLYTLERASGTLTRNGIRIHLQDQPLRFLLLLLEKRGNIVGREEIQQRLWSGNTFVDFDKSLGVVVLKVRDALRDSASNPHFVETVPRRGYRFIAPVSIAEVERSEAPFAIGLPTQAAALATVGPASTELVESPLIAEPHAIKTPRWLRHRPFTYAVAALVCVAALVAPLMVWLHRSSAAANSQTVGTPSSVTSGTPRMRRSVAVLGFRNLTTRSDQNWMSAAFAEMLNTELAASPDLRLVSGEDVADVKRDLGLPEEDTLSRMTLLRLRKNLGADVIVLGSYALLPDNGKNRLRLDIRMQDTAAGETIAQEAFTGDQNELFDLAGRAGGRMRDALMPADDLAPTSAPPASPLAANQLALQLYSEGHARLLSFDFVGARDLLKRAIYADPHYAMAHSALASTVSHLGYDALARSEAKLAVDQSQNLPEEFALAIRGQYEEIVLNWAAAGKTYAALLHLFPDNLDYGLRLATAQLHISSDEALRTLASLRALPAPIGTDPRIDLVSATVLNVRDLRGARLAAQQAIAKATTQGSTLMIARGYGILCQQDTSLGVSFDRSIEECKRARSSYQVAGDVNNAARTLNDLAGIYYEYGRLSDAESMWLQAITEFRRTDEEEGLGASSNNLGEIYLVSGRLHQADRFLHQALVSYQRTDDTDGLAGALVDLGSLSLHRGELSVAFDDFHRSLRSAGLNGDKGVVASALAGIGAVQVEQADFLAARNSYNNALGLRQDLGEKQAIAETEVELAKIRILEGNPTDGEVRARRCKTQFHSEQQADDELGAGLVVVDALIAETKMPEAIAEMSALDPIVGKTQNHVLQLRYRLQNARLALATGDRQTARRRLATTLRQAHSEGYLDIEREALRLKGQATGT